LGYGQFAPNRDMFDLNQFNPLLTERDLEIRPDAGVEATKIAAPNLIRLAEEGTRFTDYASSPLRSLRADKRRLFSAEIRPDRPTR
jgi:hypothetical protein